MDKVPRDEDYWKRENDNIAKRGTLKGFTADEIAATRGDATTLASNCGYIGDSIVCVSKVSSVTKPNTALVDDL